MKYNPNKIYIVCDGSSYYGVYGCDIEDEINENDVELYSNKGYDDWSDEVEIRYVHNGVDDWKAIFSEVPSYDEWFKIKNLASLSECLQDIVNKFAKVCKYRREF